jgi:hypothetical protein
LIGLIKSLPSFSSIVTSAGLTMKPILKRHDEIS